MRADEVYAILKGKLVKLTEDIKSMGDWKPIQHKGTVQTADDLPTDAKEGWMYNIATDSIYGAAGMNVVMTSEGWDPMGPIINMGPYLTKEEGNKTFQPKGNYLSGTDSDLKESGKAADAKVTGEKIAKNSSDITKKLDKNQGVENSGKIAGINESGDIVPIFPVGVDYNSETNCLEFGSDQKMELNQGIGLDSTLTKTGSAADAGATGKKIASLKKDLYNLPNYSFDKNYAYGIHSNDKFINGGNNLTVIGGIILPVGKYYIFAKIKIVTHTSDAYVRLYVQQVNFNSDFVKVDGSGEYFLDGHFSIDQQAEGLSSVRIDFNQGDSSRSVDVESLFIVKDSNRIISAIKNDNTDREKVCSFVLEQEYYPINMATKEDIDTLKKEFLTEPEPLFDLVKDYKNRNYSICLIGDSTSDGKAGPAIGIYTSLSQQQKSGELLDGVQVIDRGSNGSTAEAYIGSYSSNSGSLYNAIQDNADIYVVCLGINDVRQGLCTKETLKERISFIVNEILSKTKGRVILRTPNSLGNDDVSEQYIKPYTSAQKYTDILWEAYDELKNVWSCTRVRSLDMQTLVFGRKSVPSATNFLMSDVLHPSSNQAVTTMNQNWNYGMNIIGLCIACAIGYKEKPNAFEIFKAKTDNPTNPYMEYPLILESKDYATKKIYELNQGDVTATYIQFFDAQKETTILKTGDILRFGNEFCKVYNGEMTQNLGTLLHVGMAFSESELEKVKNVFTVSVYRL